MAFRTLVGFFILTVGVGARPSPVVITSETSLLRAYDYIVVGGGTSGLTVADRLSENPDHTILTIEPGPLLTRAEELRDIMLIRSHTPANESHYFDYLFSNLTSEPLTELNNRRTAISAARLFGGGSGVNGMGWGRMGKSDHDDWVEFTGDDTWSWQNMIKYYRRTETFVPPPPEWPITVRPGDPSSRGTNGPIQAGFSRYWFESNVQLLKAEKELGIPSKRDDGNGDNMGGIWIPSSLKTKNHEYERSYAKDAYYDPHKNRKNWHVLVGTSVTRVLFDKEKRAVGVEYTTGGPNGVRKTVKSKREVVIAAGATHSAPLLQVSGLGDKKLIKELGVPLVADLPLIGEGLQDHAYSIIANNYDWPKEEKLIEQNDPTFMEEQWKLFQENRTGAYTAGGKPRMQLLSFPFIEPHYTAPLSAEHLNAHDKFLHTETSEQYKKIYKTQREILLRAHANPQAPIFETWCGLFSLVLRPLSRGYIRARSSSIFDPVILDWRTLTNPFDTQVMLSGLRFSRKFVDSEALKVYNPVELVPGKDVATDEQLTAWMRETASPTTGHQCCTLSMGAASDSRARLKGVKGVRIVDSSVWPFVPGAHATQQTAYVVGEKIADLMKEDAWK